MRGLDPPLFNPVPCLSFASPLADYCSAPFSQNTLTKERSRTSPFFYHPHLGPCSGYLLLYFSPETSPDTPCRSSMFAFTYTINTSDDNLPSCCTTSGLGSYSRQPRWTLNLPPNIVQTPLGPVATYLSPQPSPNFRPLQTAHGLISGLPGLWSIPATFRSPGTFSHQQ